MTPPAAADCRLRLRAAPALLTRPRGQVQIGWDPDRAVVVTPPEGTSTEDVLTLLHRLDGSANRSAVVADAAARGLPRLFVEELLAELTAAGVVEVRPPVDNTLPPLGTADTDHGNRMVVTLIGRGPLSDTLARSLPVIGVRVRRRVGAARTAPARERSAPGGHLVILADMAVVDPQLAGLLTRARIPHLAVSLREGSGLVGPLVLPGLSSCLLCTHLYRCDRDPDWPYLAAQLAGKAGSASHATVMATAGIAQAQVEAVIRAAHPDSRWQDPPPPETLSRTVTVDAAGARTSTQTWPRHPRCPCADLVGPHDTPGSPDG